jgi:hypothetical protein
MNSMVSNDACTTMECFCSRTNSVSARRGVRIRTYVYVRIPDLHACTKNVFFDNRTRACINCTYAYIRICMRMQTGACTAYMYKRSTISLAAASFSMHAYGHGAVYVASPDPPRHKLKISKFELRSCGCSYRRLRWPVRYQCSTVRTRAR